MSLVDTTTPTSNQILTTIQIPITPTNIADALNSKPSKKGKKRKQTNSTRTRKWKNNQSFLYLEYKEPN